jgi:DNA polymerase IV
MFVITPEMGATFVETLPVGKFHGIGPATSAKMNRLGIYTGADLRSKSLPFLEERFGKAGDYYYSISRGIDERPVRPDRIRKSVGAENTFERDLWSGEELRAELLPIIDKVSRYCEQAGIRGRTVTLKVKYQDFQQITRSRTFPARLENRGMLETAVAGLMSAVVPITKGVRLLGVSVSSLDHKDQSWVDQLSFPLDRGR